MSKSQVDQVVEMLRHNGALVEDQAGRWSVRLLVDGEPEDFGQLLVFDRFHQEIVVWDTAAACETVLEKRTRFVASSRLPKKLESIPGFFEGLLNLGIRSREADEVLLSGVNTACRPFVSRLAELFGIELRSVECFPAGGRKAARLMKELAEVVGSDQRPLFVFDGSGVGIDQLAMLLATKVSVLSVRTGGNIWRGAFARLKTDRTFDLLINESLVPRKVSDELLSCGATGWYLLGAEDESKERVGSLDESEATRFRSIEQESGDGFLLHWTRRRQGPWPQQGERQFLDDLLFGMDRKDHSPIASLYRILATQKLLGSSDLTRDKREVVCFSQLSFTELQQQRVFRSHLGRWDFEPYGIAIRSDWLESRGARKVVYGDEATWDQLDDSQRPWFQFCDAEEGTDWSVEKEWRVVGDVDLREVPADAALVFVPSVEDAVRVEEVSRWPIVVLK